MIRYHIIQLLRGGYYNLDMLQIFSDSVRHSKYTILNNGDYYVHHYWDNKQQVRENVAVH